MEPSNNTDTVIQTMQMMKEFIDKAQALYNKLPALESPEQQANGLYSTARKVLSCLPGIGFGVFIGNLIDVIKHDENKDKAVIDAKGISMTRYLSISAIGLATMLKVGIITSLALKVLSFIVIGLSLFCVCYFAKEIGKDLLDYKKGVGATQNN